ncbi:ankyrin repeat domain-containing protein [Candidatus Babeliales bacterium]|nr:ankyrin repeat domain-containing protein [Candidatus Babeliales bacterium]
MNIVKKIGLLVLVMLGFAQVSFAEENHSKMSEDELNEALITAVKKGKTDIARDLLTSGANGNQNITYAKSNYDYDDSYITLTLLEYAAQHGYVDILKKILESSVRSDDINNALILAAKNGNAKTVKELLQASDTQLTMQSYLSCFFVSSEKCELCLNQKYRDSALISAANRFPGITTNPSSGKRYREGLNDYLNVIKELIKAGTNVNSTDNYENTALMVIIGCGLYTAAQRKSRAEIIEVLLAAKANVNYVNKKGRSILIKAVEAHDFDAVQIILKVPGINTNYADNYGDTALIRAIECIQSTYISGNTSQYNACVNSQKIVDELLKTPGINIHHVNKNGDTAHKLFKARTECKLLKERGYY